MSVMYWMVLLLLSVCSSNKANNTLNVAPALSSGNECSVNLQDVCFGMSAKYSVAENSPPTALGLLGPGPGPRDPSNSSSAACRETAGAPPPVYTIPHGGMVARVVGGELWSAAALDREARPGPLPVEVSCAVSGDVTYDRVLTITVIDRDDNLPTLVNVTASSDMNSIHLLDLDSCGVNSFEVEIEGDVSHILRADLSVTTVESRGLEATGISINVAPRAGRSLPESPYPVTVKVTDTNLPPPNTVAVPVVFRGHAPLISLSQQQPSPVVQYPTAVRVSRAASQHARVAEPRNPRDLDTTAGPTFVLRYPVPGINVTERAGIIYVSDPAALQRAPPIIRLTVEWRETNGRRDSTPVAVEVVDPTGPPCVDHDHRDNLCSGLEQRDCRRTSCAHGLGRLSGADGRVARCEWSVAAGVGYSTCTVDAARCPDLWCDPLERLSRNLTCLQDCTMAVLGAGRVRDVGHGVQPLTTGTHCSCDHGGSCVCAGLSPPPLRMTKNHTSPSKATQTPHNLTATNSLFLVPDTKMLGGFGETKSRRKEGCGFKCQTKAAIGVILIMSSCLFFLLFLTSRRHRRKSSSRKLVATSNSLLEAQRAADTLLQTFAHPISSHPSLSLPPPPPPEPMILPDPRWEFPRESLVIEQCLGEGEFGRVLKARAMNIDGVKGVTTVAVKTLKVTATSSEMTDLLAEYQMMKDVCHPHVVRLLGACTSTGGPVYIIIEYAEHGSLRSYLRRSRLVPPAPGSPSQAVEPLSFKTLLTFACQIANGMAYLAENKLVHRDLAARNVLLASGLLCKISDFGLSRDVYEDDAYFKRSKGRVPVKWMALESLSDHVYTTRSDVWSYGVVLWELVTLGCSPYPGVAVHSLYPLLRAGYRMDRPLTCTHSLYELMRDCWREDPLERPPFWQISTRLKKMLQEETDYLPLQMENRLVINKGYLADFSPEDDIDILKRDFGYNIPNPVKVEKEINRKSLVKYANEMVSNKAEAYDNPRPLRRSSAEAEVTGRLNDLGHKHYTVLRVKPSNQYQNDVQINIDGGNVGPAGDKESQYEVKKLLPNESTTTSTGMSRDYISMNRRASSLEARTSSDGAETLNYVRTRPASCEDNTNVSYKCDTVENETRNCCATVPDSVVNRDGAFRNGVAVEGRSDYGSDEVNCENESANFNISIGNGANSEYLTTAPINDADTRDAIDNITIDTDKHE